MRMRGFWLLLPVAMLATLTLGAPSGYAQTSAPGPTLTVVGFGLANVAPTTTPATEQLNLNLQASSSTASGAVASLAQDVAAVAKLLGKAGGKSTRISAQGEPQLNYVDSSSQASCQKIHQLKGIAGPCPPSGFQADESLEVTFPTLVDLADALTASGVTTAQGVQNFYMNQTNAGPLPPSPVALQSAYAQAIGQARSTASMLADADGVTLGAALSITEGAQLSTSCGGMGCGPPPPQGINPPPGGSDQQPGGLTGTYTTTPCLLVRSLGEQPLSSRRAMRWAAC